MNKEIERRFVRNFILPHKQERAMLELNDSRRRKSFIFNLQKYLNRGTFRPLPETRPDGIAAALRTAGAGSEGYIISTDADKDGRCLPLEEALARLDYEYEILVCANGDLAYYRESCNWKGCILAK